jgi:glycerol-3-phosphate dehydrogenase (NAD(P)+)
MITILGAGAYGTAIAHLLASQGHQVKLWCYEQEVYDVIIKHRINDSYMPGVLLPDLIEPKIDLTESIKGSMWIFEALPVKFMRSVFEQLKDEIMPDQCIVLLSKGIENSTLQIPTQIIESIFGDQQKKVVVAGPSFAKEIIKKEITGVNVASADKKIALELIDLMRTDYFKLYYSDDIIGVQACAALKNVVALGVGILNGLGCGDNTKALFMTHAFGEMNIINNALGGKIETLYGLAGMGDLILTCIGASSKNLNFGKRIGKGEPLPSIISQVGTLPEGCNTLESLMALIERYNLKMPLFMELSHAIKQQITPEQFLAYLKN